MDRILDNMGKQLALSESKAVKVSVPVDIWNKASINHELCLIGRVLRKTISLEAFERTMISGWNLSLNEKMQKVGDDRILVQFRHVVEKDCVLTRGPWVFDKKLVIFRPFLAKEDPTEVPLHLCEFLVHASVM